MRRVVAIVLLLPIWILAACAPQGDADRADPAAQTESATDVALPEPTLMGEVSVEETLAARRSVRSFATEPLTLKAVAQLLWAAQGISDRERQLRTAPSAGATYPLETYLVAGSVIGLNPGVYRYHPAAHTLSLVVEGDVRNDLADAALGQRFIADAPASVVFAAVYERTARRYGDRAQRYVHMEIGHAAQNLALQAVALGLGSVPVGAFNDDRVGSLLELPDDEAALYILPVGHP